MATQGQETRQEFTSNATINVKPTVCFWCKAAGFSNWKKTRSGRSSAILLRLAVCGVRRRQSISTIPGASTTP
jgi:hypothetical protein